MKILVAMCLASFATVALANETSPAPEQYTYGTKLDIAKVISMSEVPQVCEVVPAKMIYEDHQGQRHVLEYKVMGDGCSLH
ncbi:DUF2790 domain-containing protein [Pseudomonas sp. NPDC096917]|uniref:DUF2790 domain-containing protein n=1 Tax=Pseudomonas sp. NPDC096917 TaxID=3364483 RepID=UPI00383B9ED1